MGQKEFSLFQIIGLQILYMLDYIYLAKMADGAVMDDTNTRNLSHTWTLPCKKVNNFLKLSNCYQRTEAVVYKMCSCGQFIYM